MVRVSHHRTYHRSAGGSGGIGRDYLTSQFYLTEFRDQPFVIVDWVLGNDYLGKDDPGTSTDPNLFPLGGVDVNAADFMVRGASEVRCYHPSWHGVDAGVRGSDGWTTFTAMRNDFIGDAQTWRYRFLVRVEDSRASEADKQRWRDSFSALAEWPLFALADRVTWQKTRGLGVHGGPVDGPGDASGRAASEHDGWRNGNHFGTWGSFGDVKFTGTTGTRATGR